MQTVYEVCTGVSGHAQFEFDVCRTGRAYLPSGSGQERNRIGKSEPGIISNTCHGKNILQHNFRRLILAE